MHSPQRRRRLGVRHRNAWQSPLLCTRYVRLVSLAFTGLLIVLCRLTFESIQSNSPDCCCSFLFSGCETKVKLTTVGRAFLTADSFPPFFFFLLSSHGFLRSARLREKKTQSISDDVLTLHGHQQSQIPANQSPARPVYRILRQFVSISRISASNHRVIEEPPEKRRWQTDRQTGRIRA